MKTKNKNIKMSSDSSSDASYVPTSDVDYYSDDSDLVHDAEGVSEEEIVPDGEEDPEGFRFVIPFDKKTPDVRHDDLPVFTKPDAGITRAMPSFGSPVEAFKVLMDYEVCTHIMQSSNERAAFYLQTNQVRRVYGLVWKNISMDEFNVFIGLVLLAGIVRLPRIHMYWGDHVCWGGPKIFCGPVMSRNRFNTIMKFLRFTKIDEVIPGSPTTRVGSFLALLRQKCQAALHIGQHMAIDESLMLYKGRLHFKQFIRTKRARFGIKIFFICPGHPDWQGYSWDFDVYYGSGSEYTIPDDPQTPAGCPKGSDLTKSEAVVVFLMERSNLLDIHSHVILDNWYSSLRLATYLEYRKTQMTGIVRADRGIPHDLKKKDFHLPHKSSAFMRRKNVLAVRFEDRKTFYSLTTRYVQYW